MRLKNEVERICAPKRYLFVIEATKYKGLTEREVVNELLITSIMNGLVKSRKPIPEHSVSRYRTQKCPAWLSLQALYYIISQGFIPEKEMQTMVAFVLLGACINLPEYNDKLAALDHWSKDLKDQMKKIGEDIIDENI